MCKFQKRPHLSRSPGVQNSWLSPQSPLQRTANAGRDGGCQSTSVDFTSVAGDFSPRRSKPAYFVSGPPAAKAFAPTYTGAKTTHPRREIGGVDKNSPPCRVLPVLNLLSQGGHLTGYSALAGWPNASIPGWDAQTFECWLKTSVRHHAHGRQSLYTTTEPKCPVKKVSLPRRGQDGAAVRRAAGPAAVQRAPRPSDKPRSRPRPAPP